MLHSWSLLLGVQLWTGPSLNSLLAVFTILSLFGFARHVLKNDLQATLVAFTYALSPAVASVSIEARQYALLAALAFTGSLTHYHFALLVLGCCVFLSATL